MTTLTTEISAIQIKVLYLHFKSVKINEDLARINSLQFPDPSKPDAIKQKAEIAYDIFDIVALFENYNSLVGDIFKLKAIEQKLPVTLKKELNTLKKVTSKWRHVRNKIGGHIDLEPIQEFCSTYNYNGVFISNHLETDFKAILLLQIIESALNMTLDNSKLFDSKLNLTSPLDLNKFISKMNSDWWLCIKIFDSLSKFLYDIGKKEKLKTITEKDIGIIKF